MKALATLLLIGSLVAGALAQQKTKLNAPFRDLLNGAPSNVKVTPAKDTIGSKLKMSGSKYDPPNKGVPEPATMAVLGIGVAAMLRRRKK